MRNSATWELPATVRYPPPVEGPMAIVNVTVIPMDAERSLPEHTVVVESGRITRVAPSARVDVSGMRIVDGAGRFLIPGLADMHVHLGDPADVVLARDSGECLLYLAHGVTVVRNMWGHPFHLELRRQVEAGELPGPRVFTTSPLTDGPNPGGKPLAYRSAILTDPADARPLVQRYAARGYDQIKVYGQMALDVMQEFGAAGREYGVPMTGHCPDFITYQQAADAGMISFEHLHSIYNGTLRGGESAVDPYDADPERVRDITADLDWDALHRLADRFAAEQIWNCPTLVVANGMPVIRDLGEDPLGAYASYLGQLSPLTATIRANHPAMVIPLAAGPREMLEARRQKDALKLGITKLLHDHGAPLTVGTDAPLVVPGRSVHDELRLFVEAGLTPYQALRCATSEPARFLGKSGEWGTIAEGKRADLVLLDANPLSDISASSSIAAVFVNGYYIDRPAFDALLADRTAAMAAPLPAPSVPPPPRDALPIAGGTLVERRFGTETGVVTYAHYQESGGGWVIDEATRSHTRDGAARLWLDPGRTVRRAEISGTFPIGEERIEIELAPDAGYRVTIVDLDGVTTATTFESPPLAASDFLALTGLLVYGIDGDAPLEALGVNTEAIETHTLQPIAGDGSAAGSRRIAVDHPREPAIVYELTMTDAGELKSASRRSYIGAIGNEVRWERVEAGEGASLASGSQPARDRGDRS